MTSQISLIILSLLLSLQEGNSKGSLHGIVTAPYAGGVWGSTVEIAADVGVGRSVDRLVVTTDQFGKYSAELAAGQYKICARKPGLEESCRCIRIEEGRDTKADLSMQIDKAYVLPSDYDVMDRRLQLLAGKDAINCGHVNIKTLTTKRDSLRA